MVVYLSEERADVVVEGAADRLDLPGREVGEKRRGRRWVGQECCDV